MTLKRQTFQAVVLLRVAFMALCPSNVDITLAVYKVVHRVLWWFQVFSCSARWCFKWLLSCMALVVTCTEPQRRRILGFTVLWYLCSWGVWKTRVVNESWEVVFLFIENSCVLCDRRAHDCDDLIQFYSSSQKRNQMSQYYLHPGAKDREGNKSQMFYTCASFYPSGLTLIDA